MAEPTADLHLHTCWSDGTETPEAVVDAARASGLSAIAITDHDCTDGVPAALAHGARVGVEVIPGIELSAHVDGRGCHLLGYFVDGAQDTLQTALRVLQQRRVERARAIVARLEGCGVRIHPEEVLGLSGGGAVGRLHVARVLQAKRYVASTGEAFVRYLGAGRPAYVQDVGVPAEDAVRLIAGAGGVAVVAHPHRSLDEAAIRVLARAGIDGLEAHHADQSGSVAGRYAELARTLGLVVTGGSDCHGSATEGRAIGSVRVPYQTVVQLCERRDRRRAAGSG